MVENENRPRGIFDHIQRIAGILEISDEYLETEV